MFGGGTRCNVKGGRIRSVCPRCKQVQYVSVSPTARHRIVRCMCGQTNTYMLNHRHHSRNSLSGCAELVVSDSSKIKVILNDISPAGIGFTIIRGGGRRVTVNKDAFINYRIPGGSKMIRKIKIRNNSGTKVGALFVDRLATIAKSY